MSWQIVALLLVAALIAIELEKVKERVRVLEELIAEAAMPHVDKSGFDS